MIFARTPLALVDTTAPDEAQLNLLTNGMENLAGTWQCISGVGEQKH
jgi:hypothetical protein